MLHSVFCRKRPVGGDRVRGQERCGRARCSPFVSGRRPAYGDAFPHGYRHGQEAFPIRRRRMGRGTVTGLDFQPGKSQPCQMGRECVDG